MPALTRHLGEETIVVLDAPVVNDPRGNINRNDWDNPTETTVYRCSIQPFPMAEKIAYEKNYERDFSRTAFRVWAPPGTVVTAKSRIRWKGKVYEIFGGSGQWINFDGTEHHVQFVIRLKEG